MTLRVAPNILPYLTDTEHKAAPAPLAVGARRQSNSINRHPEAVTKRLKLFMFGPINDLLEAARIHSGLAKWNWSAFTTAEVCREAIETVRPLMAGGEVELSLAVEGENGHDGPTMFGDAAAVRRLVLNLLDNARKHTTAGRVRVKVRSRRGDEGAAWVDIEVADTGAGIPPEILERLGHAFVLNAGLVGERHIAGAGLGLAICKGIVQAHRGFLRVRSEVGVGTTITASLRTNLEAPAEGLKAVVPTDAAA